MPVTLSDLSQRLATKFEIPAQDAGNKVAHWTKLGLISTTGNPHGGSGKHREYNEEQLHLAAVLLELSRYNLQVGDLRKALDFIFPDIWKPFLRGAAQGKPSFFYFNPMVADSGFGWRWRTKLLKGANSMIVIQVDRLLDGL